MENPNKFATADGFEAAREAILEALLEIAAFDGWTAASFNQAAHTAGIAYTLANAAYPSGVRDVLRYWSIRLDAKMAEVMEAPGFADGKIREKVAAAVFARIEALALQKEAARRAAALLAAPHMAALGAKMTWASADTVWRGLNDKSTDFNFYSKRAILSGVFVSTTARWFADETEDLSETRQFLDARIENVMQIEKAKTQARKLGIDPAKPVGWLAKLRYPAGPSRT